MVLNNASRLGTKAGSELSVFARFLLFAAVFAFRRIFVNPKGKRMRGLIILAWMCHKTKLGSLTRETTGNSCPVTRLLHYFNTRTPPPPVEKQ